MQNEKCKIKEGFIFKILNFDFYILN